MDQWFFGVCRRLVHNRHDAEDAYQAAFLVLVQKSASIRNKNSISSWLHGVAYPVGSDLKKRRAWAKIITNTSEEVPEADTASQVT